ncbi:MAG TPA: hypothetical protein VF799_06540 [Geobacteraceae bacterium]
MSNVLSFYLDGTVVQAVRARITDSSVTVRDARTFSHDELEGYLAACPEKTCILSCNPSSFYQDIVYLPPAAAKFYDSLVRAELVKEHSDLTSFSFFHRTIGEATIDGALYNKIAAFSYADEMLSEYIAVFNRAGKTISHMYAAAYPIFRLASSACPPDSPQARIIIAALPGEKLILLSEKEEFEFIRKIPSAETALLAADTRDINMTIDYCFQTLRVKPAEALMFNPVETPEETSVALAIPCRSVCPLELSTVPHDVVRDYIAPLAAVLHNAESPGECDILPADYVSFKQNKKILVAGTMVLFALVLLLAGLAMTERMAIADQKSRIGALRVEMSGFGAEVASYRQLDEEIRGLDNPLAFLNKLNTAQNPESALAPLVFPRTANYSLKAITLKKGDGGITVHLEGTIAAGGLQETQAAFEGFMELMKKTPGYEVASGSVDVKQKTFSMEARYNGSGQRGK